MNQPRFEYLLQRYKEDRLSASEWKEWLELAENEEYRSIIESDIEKFLVKPSLHESWDKEVEKNTWENILEGRIINKAEEDVSGIANFGKDGTQGPRGRISFRTLRGTFILVAAACIIVGFGIWWFRHSLLSSSDEEAPIPVILPGGAKGKLTLADGSRIVLDSAANRQLAEQGRTTIVKLADGRLAYHSPGGNAASGKTLFNKIETPRGGLYELSLPDGTRVWLNAASALRYPVEFSGPYREVELSGEAYFEVLARSNMPFKVVLKDWNVEVIGTHFDVKDYPGDRESYVTLVEGALRVNKAGSSLLLQPGQTAVTEGATDGWQLRNLLTRQAIAWKNDLFSFDKTPLPEVMQQLERWYNTRLECSQEAGKLMVTGWISRQEQLGEVLKMLEYTSGIHYSMRDTTITLDAGPVSQK